MGFFEEFKKLLWLYNPLKKSGRPGEIKSRGINGAVFCPIYNHWISNLECLETSGERGSYDEIDKPDLNHLETGYNDIHNATKRSGHKFPQDIKKVVITCEYCEAYCLGQENGPLVVPPIDSIDRKKLLFDLYDESKRYSKDTIDPTELEKIKKAAMELSEKAGKYLAEHLNLEKEIREITVEFEAQETGKTGFWIILFGLVFAVAGFGNLWNVNWFAHKAFQGKGAVLSVEKKEATDSGKWIARVRYTPRNYPEVVAELEVEKPYETNQLVEFLYDPQNPNKLRPASWSKKSPLTNFFLAIIGIVVIGFGWSKLKVARPFYPKRG